MIVVPTRRLLLQAAVASAMAQPLAAPASATATLLATTELPSRRLFFRDPDHSAVRLSPDGRMAAWRAPHNGALNLFVAPLGDLTASRPVTHADKRPIARSYFWAWTNKHIVFFDTPGDENYRAYSVDIDTGATIALTPAGVRSFVQQRGRRFPNAMLFGLNARDRKLFDLVRIDVTTGDSEPAFLNPGFQRVYTTPDFVVRFGRRFLPDGSAKIQRWEPDGTWRLFLTIGVDDVFTTWLDNVSPDGRSVFMIDSRGRDKAALVEIDCKTGESQVLAEDSEADFVQATYDPNSDRPYVATAFAARKRWHLIDPAYGFDLDHLQAAQGVGEFAIASQSNQRGRTAVYYYRSDAAAEFRLYDRQKQTLLSLFKDRTDLDTIVLQSMQPVAIRASDGVMLPSYLTLPTADARNVPLVLAIHGGPYGRDEWGFSGLHQWLASRGYAVLSVNYRGSTGFGKRFIQIANQGWGGRMQDDLTDAAAWAVAEGYADPQRLGFFGASYGGYAALTAATKTPETFACIVDLFGPANLVTLMRSIPPYWHTWFSTWNRRLADPTTQAGRQWLLARSPLMHVGQIVRPLLIGQGLRDVRVTPDESATIVKAMQARHIPVTYVTFPDEGHGFARQENRIAFYALMEAFLAQHLGGRAEAVGDAFTNSTIQFAAGRSLISGIG